MKSGSKSGQKVVKKWSKSGQKVGFLTHFLPLFYSVFSFSKRGKKGRFYEIRGQKMGQKRVPKDLKMGHFRTLPFYRFI